MAFYIVTGKLGSGKTLCAVGRIQEYLQQGRRVATNLDLNVEYLLNPGKKFDIVRIPDRPLVEDMEYIGVGYHGDYDETKFGALVLDEAAKWLNTRNYTEKGRKEFINWMIHSRKFGWDVYLIVQDIESLDKQVRDNFCEHLVVCRRLDRMPINLGKLVLPAIIMTTVFIYSWGVKAVIFPALIGFSLFAITSGRIPMPRIHIGKVHYGDNESEPVVDRWVYRGTQLIHAYDTRQRFYDRDTPIAPGLSHVIPQPPKPVKKLNINWMVAASIFSVCCFAVAVALSYMPEAQALAIQVPTQKLVEISPSPKPKPLSVRISGSVARDDGSYHYFFERGVLPVKSSEVRKWVLRPFHACAVAVTVDGLTHHVTCSYAEAAQAPTPVQQTHLEDDPW